MKKTSKQRTGEDDFFVLARFQKYSEIFRYVSRNDKDVLTVAVKNDNKLKVRIAASKIFMQKIEAFLRCRSDWQSDDINVISGEGSTNDLTLDPTYTHRLVASKSRVLIDKPF